MKQQLEGVWKLTVLMSKVFILALLIGCTIPQYTSDRFDILGVSHATVSTNGDQYLIQYVLTFTPNVTEYGIHYYYKPGMNQWHYATSYYRDIDPKVSAKATRTLGVREHFVVNYNMPIKVEVIAFAGDGDFRQSQRKEFLLWHP